MVKNLQWPLAPRTQNLIFTLAVVALLGLTGLALGIADGLLKTSAGVEHGRLVLASLDRLRAQAEAAETARRGFGLTGQDSLLRPYHLAELELPKTVAGLRDLVVDPGQQAKLKALEPHLAALLQLVKDDVGQRRQQGVSADNERDRMNQANLVLGRCRALIIEMKALELQVLERDRVRLGEELHDLKSAIWGVMAGIVLLLFLGFSKSRGNAPEHPAGEKESGASKAPPGITAGSAALLGDVSKLLQSSVGYDDAFQVVRRCAAGLFADCSGALYLAGEPGNPLGLRASWGKEVGSRSSFAPGDCWAIRRGEAYLAADQADIACAHLHQPIEAPSLCVPIVAQGSVLGVLLLEEGSATGALDSLRAVATSFSNQIGVALVNMKLQETVRNLAVLDPLTGLFNHRYMEASLKREIAAAQRNSRPLGVAICELNQFKRFNDIFGRDAAEFALREIALLISKHIRSSDIACRYDGDEIALIFPEAPREAIVMRINQLREAIFALSLEHFGRRLEKISASFGISLFPLHGKTTADLMRAAQVALASAGEFGSNRVEVAD